MFEPRTAFADQPRIGLRRCRQCLRAAAVNIQSVCLDCHTPALGDVTIAQLVEGQRAWAMGEPSDVVISRAGTFQ